MSDSGNTTDKLRTAFERNRKAVSLRPGVGRGTGRTRARITEGAACLITDGRWELRADVSEKSGGGATAPDPGVIGRAALASCLAIGYATIAAVHRVPLTAIDVEVEADHDAAGFLGLDPDVSPGWHEVRYTVSVESAAPEEDVMRVLDEADRLSMLTENLRREVPVRRTEVRIAGPGPDAARDPSGAAASGRTA